MFCMFIPYNGTTNFSLMATEWNSFCPFCSIVDSFNFRRHVPDQKIVGEELPAYRNIPYTMTFEPVFEAKVFVYLVCARVGYLRRVIVTSESSSSAVAAEVQVKATVVTKDHLKAITAPREFSSPATGSQADNLFDIQDANPPFVVTPAIASTLTAANTGQSTKATTTAALATYSGTNLEGNSTTVQELAFQFAHGNYKEQIAAFRFRVTVTTGHTSQQFMVNVHLTYTASTGQGVR
eukprot:Stramenopile-MAST_4_protein_2946